ncbi:MAG: T9SS type A sorting domain-containing protein [Bacteroidetes bacterium]|nr:T9SS type A sorting domain-containing protein [Bacteroidota bacterium]
MKTKLLFSAIGLLLISISLKAQVEIPAVTDPGTWTQKVNFPGTPRHGVVAFTMSTKAYVGTGYHEIGIPYGKQDFWKWDKNSNTWSQVASLPGTARTNSGCFTIDSIGYLVSGTNGYDMDDMWGYNSITDGWTQMANFPGPSRGGEGITSTTANIGAKGYFGLGVNYSSTSFYYDFWEWDQGTNTWAQKANYPGGGCRGMIGFTIGTKFYAGTGLDANSIFHNDFWEWDQGTNTWTQKANFPGGARTGAVSFSIGNKGYVGLGYNTNDYFKDFWEYNPTSDTWVRKTDYSGSGRILCAGFSIGTKAYIGLGCDSSGTDYSDFWEYDPSSTGVQSFVENKDIVIYPNPLTDMLTIETNSLNTNQQFEIINLTGRLVYTSYINKKKTTVNMSDFPSGIYILKLNMDKETAGKKFIKQ